MLDDDRPEPVMMLQLPVPMVGWTPTPDLKPNEGRWAWHGVCGDERRTYNKEGVLIQIDRPVKMIGWVRGLAYKP